ncbi:hypothetical protein [Caldicoprobacter faecalis]|nr:hypothetical protein [Caldicoprobacter faecalis]
MIVYNSPLLRGGGEWSLKTEQWLEGQVNSGEVRLICGKMRV